ncbi:unnamed protein product [Arctia plantaginis]|uniref:Phenoloxidase-activating factor 2 n=1 Tax=Arctia plantaginis TaxID=874455 RepID=A0A8S1BP94_ARCPL|nr:unnamed protein product [Arctia plantaginis]
MRLFLLFLLVALASSNTVVYDLNNVIIKDAFTPPTTASSEIWSISTKIPTTLLEKKGDACQCVPNYMCNAEDYDAALEASRKLGYRASPCSHFSEICCPTHHILQKQKPQPDSSKVKGCGYRNLEGFGRAFAGTETKFGEFPWIVAVLDSNNTYAGAGVIISPEVVMTVAHIAKRFAPGTFKIRAGEWDTQTVNEIYEHQERKVSETYLHEEFQPKTLKNDISLLRLEQPLKLTDHINAICLPDQDEAFDGYKDCVSNGWGKNLFGREGKYAVILRKVLQNMVPHDECESLMKKTRLGNGFNLHESFVCASEDSRDNCKHDGGAALACPIGNNRYKLTGLVAWGIGCGEKDIPAVYTNVSKFRKWNRIMHLFIVGILITLTATNGVVQNANKCNKSDSVPPSTQSLSESHTSVESADSKTTLDKTEVESCGCVPYYMCEITLIDLNRDQNECDSNLDICCPKNRLIGPFQ